MIVTTWLLYRPSLKVCEKIENNVNNSLEQACYLGKKYRRNVYMTLPVKRPSYDACTWNPFDEIRRMHEYMEQMFSSFPMFDNRFGSEVLSPFVDVIEESDKIIVTTDLPGIDRENIELSLRDNSLIINAGQGKEEEAKKEGYIRKERALMQYYREIPLTNGVTENGASAQLKNGVLTVTLPKLSQLAERKIMIE